MKLKMWALGWLAGALCGSFMGVGVSLVNQQMRQPYCPQEDSCQIDYHDGAWHISEVTP